MNKKPYNSLQHISAQALEEKELFMKWYYTYHIVAGCLSVL